MAGHSKWKQIKHKKADTDEKRAKLFSKLANIITIAARDGADPQFNPTLRSAIETARKNQMPQVNVLRAVKRATEHGDLEMLLVEAYGPEGVGILVEAITDNRNRTINEIKSLFKDHDAKVAEIDEERGKVKVLVPVFGRDTLVELDTLQVQKI